MGATDPAPRRRGSRRADAPGTGPASAEGPEPRIAGLTPPPTDRGLPAGQQEAQTRAGQERPAGQRKGQKASVDPARLTDHERWLLEQLPPHWG